MTSSKGISRDKFERRRRRGSSGAGVSKPENDQKQSQLADHEAGGGGGAGGGMDKPLDLPPRAVKRLAEMLLPIVKTIATTIFPPIGPILDIAYALYVVYQNKEKLAEVAKKVSDNDIDGLAWMAAKEIAKKGVEAVADSAAENLANTSATRLKDAGLFDQVPEAEGYYKDFVKSEVSRLIDEHGEEFVDNL